MSSKEAIDFAAKGVFIDSQYKNTRAYEKAKFDENVNKLWDESMKLKPFDCIDINNAKTQIGELELRVIIKRLLRFLKIHTILIWFIEDFYMHSNCF